MNLTPEEIAVGKQNYNTAAMELKLTTGQIERLNAASA